MADRIPEELRGISWAVKSSDAMITGVTGQSGRLALPKEAQYLGGTEGLVVWSLVAADGSTTTVSGTSRRDASLIWSVQLEGQMSIGTVAGDAAFVTGFTAASHGDPGVSRIGLGDGAVQTVLPPKSSDIEAVVARNLMASATGMTVISSLCSTSACRGGSVIDPASGKVVRELETYGGASATNDEYALIRDGGDTTPAISLVRLTDGAEIWRSDFADQYFHAYFTESDEVVVAVGGDGLRIAVIPPSGNAVVSEPMSMQDAFLWPELSSGSLAVVGFGGPFPGAVADNGVVSASVLDLDGFKPRVEPLAIDLDGQP